MDELKKTMPWREVVHPNGVVQMVDAQGREVPIFVMMSFLTTVTAHMAREPAVKTKQA